MKISTILPLFYLLTLIGLSSCDQFSADHAPTDTLKTIRDTMVIVKDSIINAGHFDTLLSRHDGWTVTTRDKSLSAQFEHSLAVTADGYEIFTESPKGWNLPPYA